MAMVFTAIRAAVYGLAFISLWGWMALGVREYDHLFLQSLPAWLEPVGIVLMVAGGLVACWCVGVFVSRGKGTAAPFDPPRTFVASGPYRHVRNPMYSGGWIMLIGFSFYQRSLSMVLFSLVWLLLAHLFVVLFEEPGLEQRFGGSYAEYKKTVNRWIPRSSTTAHVRRLP